MSDELQPQEATRAGTTDRPAIALRGVVRDYSGVRALNDVSLAVMPGETVGLVGHNGAGKSTLTRILGGLESPDAGTIEVAGVHVAFARPDDAISAGVCLVPQRLSIVPLLTVEENIGLGLRRARGESSGEIQDRLRSVAEQLGITGQLQAKARDARPSTQRLVMIARALMRRPTVLLLDEPTAALHPSEAQRLFAVVDRLRSDGMAIVFISHRLDEVLAQTSRVVVLRQGQVVATDECSDLDKHSLGALIVGRTVSSARAAGGAPRTGDAVLRCRDVVIGDRVRGVTLEVRAGEVVGVAGLNGSGRSDLLRAVAGLCRLDAGAIEVRGRSVGSSRRTSLRAGVAFLPDDRTHNAVIPDMTVAATVTLANDRPSRVGRHVPLLRTRAERRRVDAELRDLDIHPRDAAGRRMRELSGGNQQKALMVRAMLSGAEVFLFDEPTEGVDVGAREDLHRQVRRLAERGAAVVVASSESDELVRVADRVVVLFDGVVAAEIAGAGMTEVAVTHACLVGAVA